MEDKEVGVADRGVHVEGCKGFHVEEDRVVHVVVGVVGETSKEQGLTTNSSHHLTGVEEEEVEVQGRTTSLGIRSSLTVILQTSHTPAALMVMMTVFSGTTVAAMVESK